MKTIRVSLRSEIATILALMLATFIILNCVSTPKQKQLMTLQTFNSMYKEYLDKYDLQPPSIQAEWKKNIDPYWKEASVAVGVYADMADPTSIEAKDKIAIYEAAKGTALKLLLTYGVEIKEK